MSREVVFTDKSPKAIGPYSQAIKVKGLVFCSGQVAINPKTGETVTGSITAQAKQILENLKTVLEASGSSLDKVVKTTVFLRDMKDFQEMNTEYAKWFSKNPPARSTVQVAALPRDSGIEIDAIATVS
ncbi:MAG: reactive intermediate/imine deaminase [Candidatus Thorarchaeota archaeon]|nr:MAG: reactive intermediate/imine deaminase [Candidatus Thorarchaeota archaeon]